MYWQGRSNAIDLNRRVNTGCGGATNDQRDGKSFSLHFFGECTISSNEGVIKH